MLLFLCKIFYEGQGRQRGPFTIACPAVNISVKQLTHVNIDKLPMCYNGMSLFLTPVAINLIAFLVCARFIIM